MGLIEKLVAFLVKRSQKEHSVVIRTLATIFGAAIFIIGIPLFILWAGGLFNTGLMLPVLPARIIAAACFIAGIPCMLSAILWQLIYGKGTPVPVVPTKHFLQKGPYRYVRNPMMLGFFLYILGWAFLGDHPAAFAAVGLIIGLLTMEIKFLEEPELERRFGNAYLDYKKETSFLLPKCGCKRKKEAA
ncbi:MAG: isoprenylcysteine carboxylmethyltransferase family protein [Candidatus Omnitrophica bacterium]|nr:isoprenylcysteine carboxylmethyltransferase family protein [Candidatus Omnitrophota bacterium]